MKLKEPIKLRQKTLADGNISLYLDIYYRGERRYEFLKMYLIPENTREDKERNKNTLALANAVKAKRVIDLQSGAYNVRTIERMETLFFSYFDQMCSQLESRKSTLWKAVRKMVLDYCKNDDLKFKHIDTEFVRGLHKHMDSLDLKQGSKHVYFAIFKAVLNQAVKDDIIDKSPASAVKGFKPSEPKRVYLTADEVRRMVAANCPSEEIKRAFLFSCMTGMRLSDVKGLTWGDVTEENGYTRITFRQHKTKWQEYLDVNRQAVSLLGERGKDEDSIFSLYNCYNINLNIAVWAKNANVNKHVTFHVARHTFATMMLSNGVDIYTVSKLVGHRDISTTQIYAKVIDEEKRRAVDKMPNFL